MEGINQVRDFVEPRVTLAWAQSLGPACLAIWKVAEIVFAISLVVARFACEHYLVTLCVVGYLRPAWLLICAGFLWRLKGLGDWSLGGALSWFTTGADSDDPSSTSAAQTIVKALARECVPEVREVLVERLVEVPTEKIIEKLIEVPIFMGPGPSIVEELKEMSFWSFVMVYAVCVTILLLFMILKPKRVVRVCEHGFVVEKAVAGSELMNAPAPDFIGTVYTESAGVKSRQGVFFRVADHLYLVKHTILGADKVWLKYKNEVILLEGVLEDIDLDFARVRYAPFSGWQMGSGKFVKRSAPTFAQVHNGDVLTMGEVKAAPTVGYVTYSGSTLPGFSGAPYYVGKQIVGIHMGAGAVNLGLDGAHVASLIAGVFKAEGGAFTTDPEELYKEMMQKGDEMEYRIMANGAYQVRMGGHYRTYDEETFDRISGRVAKRSSGVAYDAEAAGASFTYQDSENYQEPAATVMEAAGPSSIEPHLSVLLMSMQETLQTVSNRLASLEKVSTNGPERIPVRPSLASQSIQPSPEISWRDTEEAKALKAKAAEAQRNWDLFQKSHSGTKSSE
uniref:Uncharacterized protein n=1 Tax=Solemoviridae sp. TaxID=2715208 RepID=A0A6M3YS91_9VIRU|nr:MAG: hypothetical protein 1 [Solemoviridae sp.]